MLKLRAWKAEKLIHPNDKITKRKFLRGKIDSISG